MKIWKNYLAVTILVAFVMLLVGCADNNGWQSSNIASSHNPQDSGTKGSVSTDDGVDDGVNEETYYEQIDAGKYLGELANANYSDGEEIIGHYKIIKSYEELCTLTENGSLVDKDIFLESYVIYISRWYSNYWGEQQGFKSLSISNGNLRIEYDRLYWDGFIVSPAEAHYEDYIVVKRQQIQQNVADEGDITVQENRIFTEPDDVDEGTEIPKETVNK